MLVEGQKITPVIFVNENSVDRIRCPITNKMVPSVSLDICGSDSDGAPQIPVTYAVLLEFIDCIESKNLPIHYEIEDSVLSVNNGKGHFYIEGTDHDYQEAITIGKTKFKNFLVKLSEALNSVE